MDAEKDIVEVWLNQQGFFTIKDLNAGKNVIDLIGLKIKANKIERVVHVEIACSVSGDLPIREYLKKFKDKDVIKRVRLNINKFIGKDVDHEKILITTSNIKSQTIEDVHIINFSKVLNEVINRLDKQNYQNTVIRTLQLVQFVMLRRKELVKKISKKEQLKQFESLLSEKKAYSIILRHQIAERIAKGYIRKNKDWLVSLLKRMRKKDREEIIKDAEKSKEKEKKIGKVKSLKSFFK